MSEERRLNVLRAIVGDYVETSEPVGSKALVERHNLGVSAATVRNDMAILEDEGLIHAPHTSAGRVPTDMGYRVFVDRLSSIKPMSVAERRAISQFLDQSLDLDDVVDRTVRLLASLTHQVAVVQYPSISRSSVRHIELVSLGEHRLMVILIASTGRVEQRVVEYEPVTPASDSGASDLEAEQDFALLRLRINAETAGRSFAEAATRLHTLPVTATPSQRTILTAVLGVLDDLLVEQREERVVMAGQSNLARFGPDFSVAIGPVLEALEEHVVLLKLMGQLGDSPESVAVRIGSENPISGLHAASIVSTGYGSGAERLASLGVVGPTRMDYPTTMAVVRAVARYVSEIVDDGSARGG